MSLPSSTNGGGASIANVHVVNRHTTLLGLALVAIVRPASADTTTIVEGTLVSIDGHDLVLDLGASRGMSEGEIVELWRPLRVKHPVTGKILVDRFRVGALRIGQVQKTLSFARPDGELSRQPALGDVVIIRRSLEPKAPQLPAPASSAPRDPATTPPPPPPRQDGAPAPEDADAAALSKLFDELRGADPKERVRRYQEFVGAHPESRFAAVLREEAAVLSLVRPTGGGPSKGEIVVLRHAPPTDVRAGMELRVAFLVDGARAGVLHVKASNRAAYVSLPLREIGPGYLVATVPSELVVAPGVAYFAEATEPSGRSVPLFRAADHPEAVDVDDVRESLAKKRNATAALFGEYAFYGPPKKANDYVFQTEGYFGTRFGDVGVRALRSGFGVFRGAGGSLKELDEQPGSAPRKVGLTYGYVELEVASMPSLSFIGRGIVGLRDAGVGGGAQGFVRIGNDRASNLLLGGEVLGGVGLRGIAELSWRTIPRVPIVLRTEVTNQPAGTGTSNPPELDKDGKIIAQGKSEVGARAIVQVGYQLTEQLEIAARASYQGRTINHAGPGFGAGVTYTW